MRITPPIIIYLVSDLLSLLGNSIAGVVLPLVLLARTGDVLAAGSLAVICAVPQAVFGVLGGAVLDRANRRHVSVASDVVSALAVALLPVVDALWGLSFGWFVALGLLGAVGDVPGMSARDALLPEVCEREGIGLQRFVGASQSLQSLVGIAGPAVAALAMGLVGEASALWLTAACSLAAAVATACLPRDVGALAAREAAAPDQAARREAGEAPSSGREASAGRGGALAAARRMLAEGFRVLFGADALLRASVLLSLGITMALGGFQGIVVPAYFTAQGRPELVGYLISTMGAGLLAGSLVYTAFAERFSRRAWYVLSLTGIAAGVALLASFPPLPLLFGAGACTGLFAGPASALLGFYAFDRIPAERRGAGLGTLNVLYLVVGPLSVFVCSVLISAVGIGRTGLAVIVVWLAVTAVGIFAKPLRSIG